MRQRHTIILFSTLLFLLSGINICRAVPPTDETVFRNFEEEKLSDYKQKRDFNYGTEPLPEEEDFNFAAPQKSIAIVLQWLIYAAIFVTLGVLIFFVLRQSISWRKSRMIEQEFIPGLDTRDIREVMFEDMIENAIKNGEYRIAVRLLYLETLKKLTVKGWIAWKPFKTNQEYQLELQQTRVKEDFDRLTISYEYIWYGNFPVTSQLYQYVENIFRQFQSSLEYKQ
ncbi:MAG: DUF4129 domain-containing protein [Bacteroidia bacterium]